MNFKLLLSKIQDLSEEHGLNTPYIVGGVPRDVILKHKIQFNDFDITTGNEDVSALAELFAKFVKADATKLKDGHLQVVTHGLKFDFSSNFYYKNIDELLNKHKTDEIDNLIRETYSRDFTLNTLLMTMSMENVIDLTKRGLDDIDHKILSCPLDCTTSFQNSPNRILRAFYYKAKYGFKFSEDVDKSINDNLSLLSKIHPRYGGEILNSILKEDPKMIHELIERGILHHMELTKFVIKVLLDNRRILDVI